MKKLFYAIILTAINFHTAFSQNTSSEKQYTIEDLNKEIAEYKNVFYSDDKEFYDQDGYSKLVSKKEKLNRILKRITIIDHTAVIECPNCHGQDTPTDCFKCGGRRYEKNSKYVFCKSCKGSGYNNDLCSKCLGGKRILTQFNK